MTDNRKRKGEETSEISNLLMMKRRRLSPLLPGNKALCLEGRCKISPVRRGLSFKQQVTAFVLRHLNVS